MALRAFLIYYLYASVTAPNAGLGLPKTQAMAIVSIYGALVYLSGIIGGWFADRILGASQTIFYRWYSYHSRTYCPSYSVWFNITFYFAFFDYSGNRDVKIQYFKHGRSLVCSR